MNREAAARAIPPVGTAGRRAPTLARVIWGGLALLAGVLSAIAIPARHDELLKFAAENQRALDDLGMSADTYAVYFGAIGVAVVAVHLLPSGVISWRRPDEPMALFLSLALLANGTITPLSPAPSLVTDHPSSALPVDLMVYLGIVSSLALLYVFPNGKFVPPWTLGAIVVWGLLSVPAAFFPEGAASFLSWPLLVQVLILLGFAGSGAYAQIYRYVRVSNPLQRQQTKWAAVGLIAAVAGPLAFFLPSFIVPSLSEEASSNFLYQRVGSGFFTVSLIFRLVGQTLFAIGTLVFPFSFAVAILRYRLWDIDLLINRTLVYATLTGSLLAAYFVFVVLIELALRTITQQGSALAVVASTLVASSRSYRSRE